MTKTNLFRPFAFLGAGLLAVACAKDPTAGKTRAAVAEARPETAAPASAVTLHVDRAASKVAWVGAKVTAQHPGRFEDFTGTISLVGDKPEQSRVEFEVKTASLETDENLDQLEGHLRSADFFDVATHPTARFVSTEIRPGSQVPGANYTVTGNMTMRGTTKSITFPANIQVAPDRVTVKTEFGINRKDFGIVYPGMKDDLIKDNVLIKVDLAAPRTATKS